MPPTDKAGQQLIGPEGGSRAVQTKIPALAFPWSGSAFPEVASVPMIKSISLSFDISCLEADVIKCEGKEVFWQIKGLSRGVCEFNHGIREYLGWKDLWR